MVHQGQGLALGLEAEASTFLFVPQGFDGIAGGNSAAYFLKVPPSVPLDWVGFGLFICSVVGIIFGTYPAYKAATLDPIESLRYE
jgi:ABC-type antimicrobial peptide transport system permease subunit